jgi:fatty-acid desaturase
VAHAWHGYGESPDTAKCDDSDVGRASMNKIAGDDIRPWQQPFWKPARGKAAVFFYLILIHILAVAGLILYPIPDIKILGWTILLTALGGAGTTIGYHRMLAHRTIKLNKLVEHLLILGAMFNGSGAPASWVAYHRLHHARTDTPDDISSPKQGASGGTICAGCTSPPVQIGNIGVQS